MKDNFDFSLDLVNNLKKYNNKANISIQFTVYDYFNGKDMG